MKLLARIVIPALLLLVNIDAFAAVPTTVNYQGYLVDSTSAAVTDTTSISFNIYNVSTGGSPLWTETLTVPIDQGLFSVKLGSAPNSFPAGLFDNPLWIGVAIEADPEMTPRRALTSVGFAFEADNALNLDGQGASSYDQSAHVVDQNNPHNTTASQIGAASIEDIAVMQTQIAGLQAALQTNETILSSTLAVVSTLQSELGSAQLQIIALQNSIAIETDARITADGTINSEITTIQANSVLGLDGLLRKDGPDVLFTGTNLRIENGTGTTSSNNGFGNLIVGYNLADVIDAPFCSEANFFSQSACEAEGGVWATSHRNGSHNIIVGDRHNYASTSGVVVGENSNILNSNSSVVGGSSNTANGSASAVFGGENNTSIGYASVIVGGGDQYSGGDHSLIAGGVGNNTGGLVGGDGKYAAVFGGTGNVAYGFSSTVSGGWTNTAFGLQGSVFGGFDNSAGGVGATTLGGVSNNSSGYVSTVTGGAGNSATGDTSSVSGGKSNTSEGEGSSVSGGFQRTATGENDWVAGELFQTE